MEMVANNWFNFFLLFFFLNKLRFCLYVTLISLESELETYGEINLKKSHQPVLWEKIMARVNTKKKRRASDSLYISDWWSFWNHFLKTNFMSIFILQCCVSCCCPTKWIIYVIHISPPFFGFLSHLGRHRALSRGSCAVQWVLISCLFYTQCH